MTAIPPPPSSPLTDPVNNLRAPRSSPSLTRRPDKGRLGGVCAGIADTWQLDPSWVRIIVFFVSFITGIGVLVYFAAWYILPVHGSLEANVYLNGSDVHTQRHLVRLPQIGRLGGVCAGIAWQTGMNVTIVRTLAVVGIPTGVLPLLYLVSMLIIPKAELSYMPPPAPPLGFRSSVLTVGIIAVSITLLIGGETSVWTLAGYGLIVAAIWVALRSREHVVNKPQSSAYRSYAAAGVTPENSGPFAPRSTLFPISIVAWLASLVFFIGSGATFPVFVGTSLLIVAASLLVGTRYGRAPSLVPIGVFLVLIAGINSAPGEVEWHIHPGRNSPFPNITINDPPQHRYVPQTIDDIPEAGYQIEAASLSVNFRELETITDDLTVPIEVGVGEVSVVIPDDVDVQIETNIGVGEFTIDPAIADTDDSSPSIGISTDHFIDRPGTDTVLEIEIDLGLGTVHIQ